MPPLLHLTIPYVVVPLSRVHSSQWPKGAFNGVCHSSFLPTKEKPALAGDEEGEKGVEELLPGMRREEGTPA